MPFDEDPQDSTESYPCCECEHGTVSYEKDISRWSCDSCEFAKDTAMPKETTVNIYHHQAISDEELSLVTILIHEPLPEPPPSFNLDRSRKLFEKDASALAEALCESLPGGTLDHLLVELLKRHCSLLTVKKT